MSAFSIASRTRPPAMSGIPPINPLSILDLRERLYWPAEPMEAVQVVVAMDDEYRRLQDEKRQ
jgi:hypothetical protein